MLNTQYCVILYMPPDPQLLLGMSCTIWEGGDTMFKLLFLVTVGRQNIVLCVRELTAVWSDSVSIVLAHH